MKRKIKGLQSADLDARQTAALYRLLLQVAGRPFPVLRTTRRIVWAPPSTKRAA